MEAAVRHLRDGAQPDTAACATCCVLDKLAVVGGALILRHAIQAFLSAMRQGRSQATIVRLVDLTGALADIAAPPQAASRTPHGEHRHDAHNGSVELIDLVSDPWGWREAAPCQATEQPSASPAAASSSSPQAQAQTPGLSMRLEALQARLLRPPTSTLPTQATGDSVGLGGSSGAQGCEPHSATGSPSPAAAGSVRSVCVVIGCLSTLMERYGSWQALRLLEAVQRAPAVSCVLTSMHTDLHPDQLVFAVRRMCSCSVDVSGLTALQAEVAQRAIAAAAAAGAPSGGASSSGGGPSSTGVLAGRLDCRTKRRTGRVKVDSELYSLELASSAAAQRPTASTTGTPTDCTTGPRLAFHAVPPVLDTPDPKALLRLQPPGAAAAEAGTAPAGAAGAAAAAARAGVPAGGVGGGPVAGLLGGLTSAEDLAKAVGSSMRLTLTEEERRAKQQVVLPYQHQGQQHRGSLATAYAAGDHAGYLPPAAGGTGPAAGRGGQQALGHILYVRDSASEADSDQELDEDLDI